jgi:ADP-heptose:LPS heptosyltransferase
MSRFLFLDHHGFGNVVLSTPVLQRLNEWATGENNEAVVLLSSPAHKNLLSGLSLDHVTFCFLPRTPVSWLKFMVSAWRSDVLLAAPNVPPSTVKLIAKLVQPKRIIAEGLGKVEFNSGRHVLDVQEALIRKLGFGEPLPLPRLSSRKRSPVDVVRTLGLHPFTETGRESKQWPVRNFRALTESRPFTEIHLFGGPQDREKMEQIKDQWTGLPLVLPQSFDIGETLERISRCDLFLSGDTGPAHMAAGLGVPVFSIFGPTNPQRIGPVYTEHRILTPDTNCHPCYKGKWTNCRCILEIDAGKAELQFEEFIESIESQGQDQRYENSKLASL